MAGGRNPIQAGDFGPNQEVSVEKDDNIQALCLCECHNSILIGHGNADMPCNNVTLALDTVDQ